MVNERTARWHKYSSELLIAYFLLFSFRAFAGEALTFSEAKAHYTFEIIQHISWPERGEEEAFRVLVIGADSEERLAFELGRPKTLQGKSVYLNFMATTRGDFREYTVIYIAKNKLSSMSKIFSRNPHALIITDGKTHIATKLINLISTRNKVSISIHRDNLLARGFKVSAGLLGIGGSREDLREGLREKAIHLQELSKKIELEHKALQILVEQLKEKSSHLDEANKKLADNRVIIKNNEYQLEELISEIKRTRKEFARNQVEISKQNLSMEKARSVLLLKEQEIQKLQVLIEQSQEVLAEYLSKIDKQDSTILQKDQTIDTQRMLMLLVFLGSIVLFVTIYFLLKINRLKNQANQKLETVNSKLYELATTDGMTQVFNRRHFLEMAEREFVRQQRRALNSVVLMVDIDFFKQVNDRYGHAMGDETIKAVARVLGNNLRESDLLGRLGGEEFSLMLSDCSIDMAREVAQRLCKDVAELEIVFKDFSVRVTVSIGLSEMRAEDSNLEVALHRADKALYQAKEGGRNSVSVYDELVNS